MGARLALTIKNRVHLWMRPLLAAAVFVCLLFLLGGAGEAAGTIHRITGIDSHAVEVDGRAAQRIEITVKKAGLHCALSERYHADNQLLVELEDVALDEHLPHEIALDGAVLQRLVVIPRENHRAALRIYAGHDLRSADAYRMYTVPGTGREKNTERLVIEIFADGGDALSKAVMGHTVVIDPGHGGSDTGAIGPSGACEKDVALAVSLRTRDLLTKAGAHVVMTRTDDVDVAYAGSSASRELQARVDAAAAHEEAELFLSVHCNSFSNPDAHGMETYYYPKTDADERFATLLNEELAAAGGLYNRGVKYAHFYVLKHSDIPASLAELGFISNPEEEQLLTDPAYQEILAQALFRAIARYFEE